MKKCAIEGCDIKVRAQGLCHSHYRRMRLYGDPKKVAQVQHHNVTPYERFWLRVSMGDDCWEWTGNRDEHGYGRMRLSSSAPVLVHRLSWQFANGEQLKPEVHIMHKCDNPSCVRPSHLQAGTHADNMADKSAKGRHVYGVSQGEKHGCSKLTEEQVLEIRASSDTGVSLAKQYGVSPTQISDIRNRRSWRHLNS